MVDAGLLVVAQIAGAQGGAPQVVIDGEHLPHRRRVAYPGGYDVVVVVALGEYLVVGLAVIGREHDAGDWQPHLVSHCQRMAPVQGVGGGGCGRKVEIGSGLCGIVGVAGVVDETYVGVDVSTHIKSQGASLEMEIA